MSNTASDSVNDPKQAKEWIMPHVIVKLWPGKSEQQKTRLAEAITKDVMEILHYGDESVSVAMEEVKSSEWTEKVYQPDIKKKWDKLYKKPGYDEKHLWGSKWELLLWWSRRCLSSPQNGLSQMSTTSRRKSQPMQTESQIRTMPPVLDKYAQGRMACICLPETSGSGSRGNPEVTRCRVV
jgi:4-oxalocrotonate tautomerase